MHIVALQGDVLALLKGVTPEGAMRFSYHNIPFYCDNAHVTTVMQHLKNATPECKQLLNAFLARDPGAKTFIKRTLHPELTYHITPYGQQCMVVLKGGLTLSEALLESGYAVLQSQNTTLQAALERAKYHEKGIWSSSAVVNCMQSR